MHPTIGGCENIPRPPGVLAFLISSLVTDSVVKFLQNIPPFQFLSRLELARLAGSMALEFFPKDKLSTLRDLLKIGGA